MGKTSCASASRPVAMSSNDESSKFNMANKLWSIARCYPHGLGSGRLPPSFPPPQARSSLPIKQVGPSSGLDPSDPSIPCGLSVLAAPYLGSDVCGFSLVRAMTCRSGARDARVQGSVALFRTETLRAQQSRWGTWSPDTCTQKR